MAENKNFKYEQQLCWKCKNACGGCEWSRKLLPVEGWEAEETTVGMTVYEEGRKIYKQVKSFKIKNCPKFIKEEVRREADDISRRTKIRTFGE